MPTNWLIENKIWFFKRDEGATARNYEPFIPFPYLGNNDFKQELIVSLYVHRHTGHPMQENDCH